MCLPLAGLAVPHYCSIAASRPGDQITQLGLPFDPDTARIPMTTIPMAAAARRTPMAAAAKLERRAERFSNNWAAQQACWRRERLASMAKRAAAAVA